MKLPNENKVVKFDFGGIADAQHRDVFPGNECFFPKVLDLIGAPIAFGYHSQTCRPAIHGIKLTIGGRKLGII